MAAFGGRSHSVSWSRVAAASLLANTRCGSSGRSHDVPENPELGLKRLHAVVLVVPRGHRHDEIEFRHDANVLAATTLGADPADCSAIGPDAAEPPQISIELMVRRLDLRRRGGLDPLPGHD